MKQLKTILYLFFTVILCSPTMDAYSGLSPYSYCGGNPINCIDPDGKDIVVLNFTEGMHLAMLIQDENGEWQYFSINGDNVYFSGSHTGGRPFNDVAVGNWDSPQEFLNSPYNVRDDNSKEDKSKNNFGYSEGFQIATSPEQDAIMRKSFIEKAGTPYFLLGNNCATIVQSVMNSAGIPVPAPTIGTIHIPDNKVLGEPEYNISIPNIRYILPGPAFKSIMKMNPSGKYIHK